MRGRAQFPVLAALFAVLLANCSGGSTGSGLPTVSRPGSPEQGPSLGIASVYIANGQTVTSAPTNGVLAFPVSGNGNIAPSVTIAGSNTMMSSPYGIAFDASGNLYVSTNAASGGDTPPSQPSCINVFASGASGNVAPVRSICGTNTTITNASGIGIDSSGKLYVTDLMTNRILIFAAGANGNVAPIATLAGPHTSLGGPDDIAFDAAGNIYVSNSSSGGCGPNGSITIYAAGATGDAAPIGSVGGSQNPSFDRVTQPTAVALDSSGNIYVTNDIGDGTVLEFAHGSTENSAPIRNIMGPATLLNFPVGVQVDSAGRIYVSNGSVTAPSIYVYSSSANGDAPPSQVITGSATGLTNPGAIALR